MGKYKKAVITGDGMNLMARSIAGEVTMQFSHVKTSSHAYPAGTNLAELTVLEGVEQSVIPSNMNVVNDTLISVRSLFSNESITEEYLIQNIGLYATDGEREILFSISQADMPDLMPVFSGEAPSSFIYNIQPKVSQAASLSLSVNPAGMATVQDIMELENPEFNDSGTVSGITDKSSLLSSLFSGMPMAQFMSNVKAGFQMVMYEDVPIEINLPVINWSAAAPYTQTVAVAGVTAEDSPVIGILIADGTTSANVKAQNKAWGYVDRAVTGDGTITFYCYNKKPEVDFSVLAKGVG